VSKVRLIADDPLKDGLTLYDIQIKAIIKMSKTKRYKKRHNKHYELDGGDPEDVPSHGTAISEWIDRYLLSGFRV